MGVLCSFFWKYYAPSFDFENKWSKKLITDLTDKGFSPNPSRHICYFPYSDKRKLMKTGMLELNSFICLESTEDIFSQALYKGNNNSNPRFIFKSKILAVILLVFDVLSLSVREGRKEGCYLPQPATPQSSRLSGACNTRRFGGVLAEPSST